MRLDSGPAFVPSFPQRRPVKLSEPQTKGPVSNTLKTLPGPWFGSILPALGTSRATGCRWRVIMIASPRPTQCSNLPKVFFASKVLISVLVDRSPAFV